mgnify:CR=1 FL=1
MAKNVFETITTKIDKDGGEVLDIERVVKRKVDRDKFAMMYLKDISSILELDTKAEYKTLISLVYRASYNTNEVRVMLDVKKEISAETKISIDSVEKAIITLGRKGILIRKTHEGKDIRGVYILNPNFFFKGEEMERAKVITMVLQYVITD